MTSSVVLYDVLGGFISLSLVKLQIHFYEKKKETDAHDILGGFISPSSVKLQIVIVF